MTNQRTELNELGEFGLIQKITENIELNQKSTIMGIGDDAAVIKHNKHTVISTDMLLEGIHFDLSYVPLVHLGYKAVAVNISDIAAMNAVPTQITTSIAISNRFSIEAIEALYEGIKIACKQYHVDLAGGDTTSSASGLVISVTAIGEKTAKDISSRKGAQSADILCVSGDLGAAYVGLQVLEREKQVFLSNPDMKPEIAQYAYVVQRQLKPEARMDIVHELADLNIVPTSMIDISDGLASEVIHLQKASNLDFRLYEDKIPIDKLTYDTALSFNIDPITCALNGGEDYELLFTIAQDEYTKLKNHADIHFIGHAVEKGDGSHLVTKNENIIMLKAQGWNHLKKVMSS